MSSSYKVGLPLELVNLSSDPAVASNGQIYYNTSLHKQRIYQNGTWIDAAGSGSANTSGAVYPPPGIPLSDGLSWVTTYTTSGSGSSLALTTSPTLTSPNINTSTTTSSTTFNNFNTTATTVNEYGAATSYTLGGTPTTTLTANIFTNATISANQKTINIGTGGVVGSTTNINIGSANGFGTTTVNSASLAALTVNAQVVNATTGFRINGTASSGTVLAGNGSTYISTALSSLAVTSLTTNLISTGLASLTAGVLNIPRLFSQSGQGLFFGSVPPAATGVTWNFAATNSNAPVVSLRTADDNIIIGANAARFLVSGQSNIGIGSLALDQNNGTRMIGIGRFAGGSYSPKINFGAITGGSGYTNGTYYSVGLTYVSGSQCSILPSVDITVSGGAVTSIVYVAGGQGADVTTVFSASAASIGGTGSGFSVPVSSVTDYSDNVAVGYNASSSNKFGSFNTNIGSGAGIYNYEGDNNTTIGYRAGAFISTYPLTITITNPGSGYTDGSYINKPLLVVGGRSQGHTFFVNITVSGGAVTVVTPTFSFQGSTGDLTTTYTANGATGLGAGTGLLISVATKTTSSNNTAIGSNAAQSVNGAMNNVYLGWGSTSSDNLTNAIAIGANSNVTTSNSMVLGSNVNVGIGISAPTSSLHVFGSVATKITSTTINLALTAIHYTVTADATAGNIVITLPAASTCNGRIYIVLKSDVSANTVTINTTIGGNKVISTQFAGYQVQSNGSNFFVIGAF